MHGAVAAGHAAGGYATIFEAAAKMGHRQKLSYLPDPERHRIYNALFAEYRTVHDYFGRGRNDVMKTLKGFKRQAAS